MLGQACIGTAQRELQITNRRSGAVPFGATNPGYTAFKLKGPRLNLLSAYAQTDGLIKDDEQARIVSSLASLQAEIVAADSEQPRWWSAFLRPAVRTPIRGLYLWGSVGRGKTFLMDLFFDTLETPHKRRVHFHRLMSEVHQQLAGLPDVEYPLQQVAKSIARNVRVLCFDEFFVHDIGDAMILAGLLDGLFQRGVTLVATSNLAPGDLYRDGLQRERFLPAIRLLETHTRVVRLDAGPDYRLRLLESAGTLFSTSDSDVEVKLSEYFDRIAPGADRDPRSLTINGRPVLAVRATSSAAWFEFAALCEGPRSTEDYIEIAHCFKTVVIANVPVLDRRNEDAARRFIALVDEFYERRVKLILSTDAGIENLYQGSRLGFEFQRTVSRLTEMQSQDYLSAAHRP